MGSKFPKNGITQKKFADKCAKWVALNNRLISIVQDDGFRLLMKEVAPKYNKVHGSFVQNRLLGLNKSVDVLCMENLARACSISVTTDVWTDSCGSSYASFTAHFMDAEWQLGSHLLACSNLIGKHTSSELAQFLTSVAKKYSILHKVLFVSLDNARNAKLLVELTAEQEALLFEITPKNEEGSGNFIEVPQEMLDVDQGENDLDQIFDGQLEDQANYDLFFNELHTAAAVMTPDVQASDNTHGKHILGIEGCEFRATLNRMPCHPYTSAQYPRSSAVFCGIRC